MANKNTTMLLNLVLILSVVFLVSTVEGNRLFGSTNFGASFSKIIFKPACETVLGVKEGDTCFTITQQLKLTAETFSALNPNLICDNLFVGQWVCVAAPV